MIGIEYNLDKVQGGVALALGAGALLGSLLGLFAGSSLVASYQDGYRFTGVKGSGFETDFMLYLNKQLDEKRKLEVAQEQLYQQRKTNEHLRSRY